MVHGEILLAAFTEAVSITLREMAGLEAVPRGVVTSTAEKPTGVCACLQLISPGDGDFAIDFPVSLARELTRRIFADSGAKADDSLLADCIGEVANVIAGQAKTLTVGTPQHFLFSTPILVPEALPHSQALRSIVTFASEIGEFTLYLRAFSL